MTTRKTTADEMPAPDTEPTTGAPPIDGDLVITNEHGTLTFPAQLLTGGHVDLAALQLLAPPRPKTVHQAIAAVMSELDAVGKDRRGPAEQGGYAYRGIEDVTAALKTLCGKHGVVLWPRARVVDAQPSVGMRAGWFDWRIEVTYNVAGPDGSILEPPIEVLGIGRDNSDKGINKAMTQAYKYALLQLFMVADAKDDTDQHGAYDQGRVTEADQGPRLLPREVFDDLAAQIKSLPPVAREHLMAAWAAEDPMEGGSYLPMDGDKPALRFVQAEHEQAVRALIASGLRASKEAGEAPVSPQDGPAADPAPDTADDAPSASESPSGDG